MEIGSHSASHRLLVNLSRDAVSQELSQSKKELEDRLGQAVDSFAVPFGFVNQMIIDMAFETGYRTVCTSEAKLVTTEQTVRIYGRYGIRRGDGLEVFKGIVKKKPLVLLRVKLHEEMKRCLKNFLGLRLWLSYREKLLSLKL